MRFMGNPVVYVILYILFMLPTYYLPYLGSNSFLLNAAGVAAGAGISPAFWPHLGSLIALIAFAWFRGSAVGKIWLIIFPILAAVFDLVPGLSSIPLVPTVMHLLAIILGVVGATASAVPRQTSVILLVAALLSSQTAGPAFPPAEAVNQAMAEADATVLRVAAAPVLLDKGSYPRFSRDGSQLLYSKMDARGKNALWLASVDGKIKKPLLSDAYNGSWAPDGGRIACCRPRPASMGSWSDPPEILAIYDVRMGKVFNLLPVPRCHDADVFWARDASKLLYDNHGLMPDVWMIDLDTLKVSGIQSGYESADWFRRE